MDVRGSAEFICSVAEDVSIDREAVARLAASLEADPDFFHIEDWVKHELNPKTRDESMVNWIFVVDTLNFSFFADKGQELFACDWNGKRYTGYWSLCACINRALAEGIAITDPVYYQSMTLEQFEHVFRSASSSPVPLLRERHRVLTETGTALVQHYAGRPQLMIDAAAGDVRRFLALVCQHLPSFRDEAVYKGRPVFFLKRAQILAADLWAAFAGAAPFSAAGWAAPLTMFADYRVPQMLLAQGVLRYSPELLQLLRDEQPPDARLEAEIRAASIHAVELVRQLLPADQPERYNAVTIDFYLWDLAKAKGDAIKQYPIHKLRTIFY